MLKLLAACLSVTAALVLPLGAASAPQSPWERYESGLRVQGAFSLYESVACDQNSFEKYSKLKLEPSGTGLASKLDGSALTSKEWTASTVKLIDSYFNVLNLVGDPAVKGRHLCLGTYREAGSTMGNAKSMVAGFLVFDYRIIQYLYRLPPDKRSNNVMDFLVLHEWAHQLQYWNDDPRIIEKLEGKTSSKKTELAADCVAGALFTMKWSGLSADTMNIALTGLRGASEALGDNAISNPDHHGLPAERKKAVEKGVQLVQDHLGKNAKLLKGLTTSSLLSSCYGFVDSPGRK